MKSNSFLYHAKEGTPQQTLINHVEGLKKSSSRRVTFAGEIRGTNICIATAICREGDTFTRARGRQIATGRLAKNKFDYTFPLGKNPQDYNTKDFIETVKTHLLK